MDTIAEEPAVPTVNSAAVRQAFAAVFTEHARPLLRALRYLGVAEADLEDVAQEVFLIVHRKLDDFVPRSSVRSWILGIAAKVASDYRRKAFRRHERANAEHYADAVLSVPPPTPGLEARQAVIQLLACLDEKQRAVVVLHDVEGLSVQEIAETLGCELQTAYSRLRRAREGIHREARRIGLKAKS